MPTLKLAMRWLQARGQDQINAMLARKIFEDLQTYLKGSPKAQVFNEVTIFRARDFGSGPLYERLTFEVSQGNSIYYNARKQVVHLGMGPRGGYTPMDAVVSAAKSLASPMLRRELIHEITHHVDSHRMEEGWNKALDGYSGPGDKATYFNSPIEMNAYFQQGLSQVMSDWANIQRDFTPDLPNEDAYAVALMDMMDMAKLSFSDFFKDALRPLPADFWKYMTPENQRRFKKRVYDAYDSIVLESKRNLAQLRRKRDPILESLE